MSDVYKRPGSPYWYFDVSVDGVRKRRSTKRTKKSEAEAVAREELKQALDVSQLGASREITLREALFDHYLPSVARKASYVNLKRACEYLVGDRPDIKGVAGGGNAKLHSLTTPDLQQYRNRRSAAGMSDQSIDHEIKCVSAAHHMVSKGYRVNPALEFPMVRPKGRPVYLSEAEEAALLTDLNPARPFQIRSRVTTFKDPLALMQHQRQDNYDLVVMLLDTGARYGEIARIPWSRINVVTFEWIDLFRSKVENESRLATTQRVQAILRRRYADRGNSPFVFPGWASAGLRDNDVPRVTSAAIRRSMNRVGINSPENVERFGRRRDVRALRDTFATKLRRGNKDLGIKGLPLDVLQKLLGHSTPQMTQKYAHLGVDEASMEAVAALDQLNGGVHA